MEEVLQFDHSPRLVEAPAARQSPTLHRPSFAFTAGGTPSFTIRMQWAISAWSSISSPEAYAAPDPPPSGHRKPAVQTGSGTRSVAPLQLAQMAPLLPVTFTV